MVKQCRVEPCMLKNYSGNFLIMLLINMNQTNRKWSMLQNFHEIGVWTNGLCKPHSNLCVLHKVRKISPRKVIVTRMPSFRVGKLPLNLAAVTGGGNFLLVIGMGWCVVYIYQSIFLYSTPKGIHLYTKQVFALVVWQCTFLQLYLSLWWNKTQSIY